MVRRFSPVGAGNRRRWHCGNSVLWWDPYGPDQATLPEHLRRKDVLGSVIQTQIDTTTCRAESRSGARRKPESSQRKGARPNNCVALRRTRFQPVAGNAADSGSHRPF